ncbi:MAG: DNA polymerase III subunit alpha [Candidatus Omnitrophica bacterium]|nr:DNA polymerase III subunit alpha [Candidatus Omnitrophota bacterium]
MQHEHFVHLHLHTPYSLLAGACFIPQLMELAHEYRMPAVTMTDHGNLFGAIEFYDEAMKHGIKPIIGCEVFVAPTGRRERAMHPLHGASSHFILLAKNETGYKNLMKLVSAGYLEGFYYKPRVDRELLRQHAEGLIGLSGCLKGEIPHLTIAGQKEKAREAAVFFKELFAPGDFYLELQYHDLPEETKVNETLIQLGRELHIPLCATNNVHYLHQKDAKAHDALLCIQTQTTLEDPHRMRYVTPQYYFKSPQEMNKIFQEIPEAIRNTIEIAEKCNLQFDFTKTHLPSYQPPKGKTREEFLRELCYEGLKKRYSTMDRRITERIEHELSTLKQAGFTSYFLITWDFVHYAKGKGIPVGPGRGSVAGSLVSYALGITDIDPLKYDLLFERFLNPDRVSLPDIDIDFCYERRGEVIAYVTQKYSPQNVAQIITFGTMQARAVIRDVGRVMNMLYPEVDRIAKLVPNELNITLRDAIKQEPELKKLSESDPKISQLIETSFVLEGLTRHASIHAAGVVISDQPLTEYMPLFRSGDEQITTGYDMKSLEKIGLLKIDFLGLRTLTVIEETLKEIEEASGQKLDLEQIPLNDPLTYKLLSDAETIGVFQLESSGMRDLLKKMGPSRFEDIIALLALFRPGPIGSGMVDDFISRKHNPSLIRYDDPRLEPVLKETYGIIVYQEQVMRIASTLGGFTLSQADSLRRAMAKKEPEMMERMRKDFIDGATKHGTSKRVAEKTFNLIEYFSGYGFNKSHSTAYAMISFRTAYLKAHYPVEFMTALLTSEKDDTDKIIQYTNEATRMGIKILPPSIHESHAKFTKTREGAIRFGLSAVKNVGAGAIESILTSRKVHGGFHSLLEFCEQVDLRLVNRKVLESLIKCGAFDSLGLYRSQMMAMLDQVLQAASRLHRDRQGGQLSFFDTVEEGRFSEGGGSPPSLKEWPENQLLSFERELLGFYVTGHPLARYEKLLQIYSTSTGSLRACQDGEMLCVGGIIGKAKLTTTKRLGEKMAILTLEDLEGAVEVLVFPSTFSRTYRSIRENGVVFVKGRVSLKEEAPKVIAEEIVPVEEAKVKLTGSVSLNLHTAALEESRVKQLREILHRYPGDVPLYLNFKSKNKEDLRVLVDHSFYILPTEAFEIEVENVFGKGVIEFKGQMGSKGKDPSTQKILDNKERAMV